MKLIDRLIRPSDTGLTADQAALIERVAGDGQTAEHVLAWIAENRTLDRKFILVWIPLVVVGIIAFILYYIRAFSEGIAFTDPGLYLIYAPYLIGIPWVLRYVPGRRRHSLSTMLFDVIARCEAAQKNPSLANRGAVARKLRAAESRFYWCWSPEHKGRAPARYKRELRRLARAAASALGSYIPSTVLCDTDRFGDIRDNVARAIIQMAVGRWERVADLGVDIEVGQEERWTDVLGARLNHQATTGLIAVVVIPVLTMAGLIMQFIND